MCQQERWEMAWNVKLTRAKTFLDKLKNRSMPGVEEVSLLVNDLESQYTSASWGICKIFAQTPGQSITRVGITDDKRVCSPLSREVLPEDITETQSTDEWTEMDDSDYSGNNVASTDSLHSVDLNYSNSLDSDASTWNLSEFSPKELESPTSDTNIDFDCHDWDCGFQDNDERSISHTSRRSNRNTPSSLSQVQNDASGSLGKEVFARGPDKSATNSTVLSLSGSVHNEQTQKWRVEEVLASFWDFVNDKIEPGAQSEHQSVPLKSTSNSMVGHLNISEQLTLFEHES